MKNIKNWDKFIFFLYIKFLCRPFLHFYDNINGRNDIGKEQIKMNIEVKSVIAENWRYPRADEARQTAEDGN